MAEIVKEKKAAKSSKEKQSKYEESIVNDCTEKIKDMKSWKSVMFYICLVVLNVCTLLVALIWLKLDKKIECFEMIGDLWDFKTFAIMLALFVFVNILYVLPSFLKYYNTQKQRRFWLLYSANARAKHYECLTVGKKGETAAEIDLLNKNNVRPVESVAIAQGKRVIEKLSIAIIALIMCVVGAFIWLKDISGWLFALALIALLVNISYIVFVFIFVKNKKKGLILLGRICKFLYNVKIIKDYESFYNKCVDGMVARTIAFKQNKAILLTEIASYLLIFFLRFLILYVCLCSINMKAANRVWSLLFCFVLMDMIIQFILLQKGTLIVEILFLMLFTVVFTQTYVFWGLIIYKLFEYFMYIIHYGFVSIVNAIIGSVKSKKKTSKTKSVD